MTLTRREILCAGGGFAALTLSSSVAWTDDIVDIVMKGRDDGSQVWFDPIGVLIKPGQTVRWTNLNPGNSHTTTAYSPKNFGRPLRMPEAARPWASDYLLPNETFSVTFTERGVYDYFCIPHEHAGMVGRIIVGEPVKNGWIQLDGANGDLPEEALEAFPTVEEIMAKGVVLRA
ncbi:MULTISPECIES: plastocyanin/azurin family copper-binding protein [unclassified Mesorhizobium]|uniref:plastocyanin/azurin family copper-binding protein n=1 Tax=unclassified Mesorhizobium TaxID=325217 RepID=UPI0016773CBD|nr:MULTISPECIES: plastocyanin/azurin family copper-binding protein [unclassified Mesorhizobium]